jgi:CheY-like chemotaxis protein
MPKDVKLLLVEDNKVNQTVSVAMLTVPEQYQIDIAANGYSVIIMAEQTWC